VLGKINTNEHPMSERVDIPTSQQFELLDAHGCLSPATVQSLGSSAITESSLIDEVVPITERGSLVGQLAAQQRTLDYMRETGGFTKTQLAEQRVLIKLKRQALKTFDSSMVSTVPSETNSGCVEVAPVYIVAATNPMTAQVLEKQRLCKQFSSSLQQLIGNRVFGTMLTEAPKVLSNNAVPVMQKSQPINHSALYGEGAGNSAQFDRAILDFAKNGQQFGVAELATELYGLAFLKSSQYLRFKLQFKQTRERIEDHLNASGLQFHWVTVGASKSTKYQLLPVGAAPPKPDQVSRQPVNVSKSSQSVLSQASLAVPLPRPELPKTEFVELEMTDGSSDWRVDALCAQIDPELFFPEKGGSTREAKKICNQCDVVRECLQDALSHEERFGIWGNTTERERRKIRWATQSIALQAVPEKRMAELLECLEPDAGFEVRVLAGALSANRPILFTFTNDILACYKSKIALDSSRLQSTEALRCYLNGTPIDEIDISEGLLKREIRSFTEYVNDEENAQILTKNLEPVMRRLYSAARDPAIAV
jgi:WhiB family redox-sensing transcriptional regulator